MYALKILNYRCFYNEQTAHLAPLTILVGENSTGKSSLLAIIRIMWSIATMTGRVSFNDAAFPLGGFDDIVSHSSQVDQDTPKFTASIDFFSSTDSDTTGEYSFKATFIGHMSAPRILNIAIINNTNGVSLHFEVIESKTVRTSVKTPSRNLTRIGTMKNRANIDILSEDLHFLLFSTLRRLEDEQGLNQSAATNLPSAKNAEKLSAEEKVLLVNLIEVYLQKFNEFINIKPMAPIRTKPKRVYERGTINQDHEGVHIPDTLANTSYSQNNWETLRQKLNQFGKKSGLFEDLCVQFYGDPEGSLFQIRFKTSEQNKENDTHNRHNIANLGYGVSQVLPIITELHMGANDDVVLMQQPEVHLHPRAQAELGSVLCEIAGKGRMVFVETHSDYLLDRVRINIRKGVGNVTADDVSILFFKKVGEAVEIYSLKLDNYGNIVNAPREYMEFFMNEKNELLGLA